MPLSPGTTLGPYSVTAKIGEGGMGEVYRARDTKLDRDVALKVLPEAFTSDPDRLARFEREAKVLASLNHPNIGGIHGLEESAGVRALVLEYIEGPTLADRIAQGPIPIDEALPIAKQIAEALEAAHEAGVIHRDLKPANIKLKPDGTVKVLDFGLAKALDTTPEGDPSLSPTLTAAATQMGVIMGTAAYMSPEQARGRTVDKRADIWAFGAVLYEMLTGTRAFKGEDVSLTLSAVLQREPEWETLRSLPPGLKTYVRRCLQKDPTQRVQAIGDVRLAMEGAFETEATAPTEPMDAQPAPQSKLPWVAAVVLTAVVAILGTWVLRPLPPPAPVTRFASPFEEGQAPTGVMRFMADGSALVYVGPGESGEGLRLWVRRWADLEATPVRGTEGAVSFVLSPDEREVAFAAFPGPLRVVSLDGGPVRTLVEEISLVQDWAPDGTVYFQRDPEFDLASIPAAGGGAEAVEVLTGLLEGERYHVNLTLLPGGTMGVFQVFHSADGEDAEVWAIDLNSGERSVLIAGTSPQYAATGHLLFGTPDGVLMAAALDPARAELIGPAAPVVEGLTVGTRFGGLSYRTSDSGTLIYRAGGVTRGRTPTLTRAPVWVERDGQETATSLPLRDYTDFNLSPDGTRAAFTVDDAGNQDVWVGELDRGTLVRLTSDPATDRNPVWSPDGDRIAFASNQTGAWEVLLRVPDGTGDATVLATFDSEAQEVWPWGWSPDGSTLTVVVRGATSADIGTIPSDGSGTWEPLIQTEAEEEMPAIAPNGQWIAYMSDETGNFEVYLQRYPDLGGRRLVSVGGGTDPIWSSDSRELLYGRGGPPDAMMRVTVDVAGDDRSALTVGTPELLFDYRYRAARFSRNYGLSPDGQRLLMITGDAPPEGDTATQIILVQNFAEELTRLVPVD